MNPCSEKIQPMPRIPGGIELAALIDSVLGDWAFLSGIPSGRPVEGPAKLPVEFSVALRGRCFCLLNIRCDGEFAAELAQAATGDPGAREQGSDAFKELCNLVASHLWSSYFALQTGVAEPFVPEPSTPLLWPPLTPDSECVLMVGRFPLEARLWVEMAPETSRG